MDTPAKKNCWPWSHKWTMWEQYDARMKHYGTILQPSIEPIYFVQARETRRCLDCGTTQDRKIRRP